VRSLCLDNRKNGSLEIEYRVYATRATAKRGAWRLDRRCGIKVAKRNQATLKTATAFVDLITDPDKGVKACVFFFNKKDLGAGSFAHELLHCISFLYRDMLTAWALAKKGAKKTALEEKLATECDEITRLFWNWYLKKRRE